MNDGIKALEQFFNDIISQVIPGAALLLTVGYMFELKFPKETSFIVLFFAFSYVAGHIVLAVDDILREKVSVLCSFFNCRKKEQDDTKEESASIKQFSQMMIQKYNFAEMNTLKTNEKRSLAMSFDKEASDLAKRFMFLHLSCRTTVFLLLIFVPILVAKLCYWYNLAFITEPIGFFYILFLQIVLSLVIGLLVIYPLEKRSLSFKKRADEAPFTVALAKLLKEEASK